MIMWPFSHSINEYFKMSVETTKWQFDRKSVSPLLVKRNDISKYVQWSFGHNYAKANICQEKKKKKVPIFTYIFIGRFGYFSIIIASVLRCICFIHFAERFLSLKYISHTHAHQSFVFFFFRSGFTRFSGANLW